MTEQPEDTSSTEKWNPDAANNCFADAIELVSYNLKKRKAKYYSFNPFEDISEDGNFDPDLYHYTTARGIQGIVEDNCLHASAAYYMNDSSEIDYGCHMFSSILDQWCKLNENQDSLAVKILKQTAEFFKNLDSLQSALSRIYAVCFCKKPNLLSQWRAYGQSGGYSIGFQRNAMESLSAGSDSFRVRLERVIYEKNKQEMILQNVLADTLPVLDNSKIEKQFNELDERGVVFFFRAFSWSLHVIALNEIVRFKHPAFEEEKEWRLIVQPILFTDPKPSEVERVKFKPSRGVPMPYIELKPESGLLPITCLRYGPTVEKKHAKHALGLLLQKRGYKNIPIYGSEIPIRL